MWETGFKPRTNPIPKVAEPLQAFGAARNCLNRRGSDGGSDATWRFTSYGFKQRSTIAQLTATFSNPSTWGLPSEGSVVYYRDGMDAALKLHELLREEAEAGEFAKAHMLAEIVGSSPSSRSSFPKRSGPSCSPGCRASEPRRTPVLKSLRQSRSGWSPSVWLRTSPTTDPYRPEPTAHMPLDAVAGLSLAHHDFVALSGV